MLRTIMVAAISVAVATFSACGAGRSHRILTLAVSASGCRLAGFARISELTEDPPHLFRPTTLLLQAKAIRPQLYDNFARALASVTRISQPQLWS